MLSGEGGLGGWGILRGILGVERVRVVWCLLSVLGRAGGAGAGCVRGSVCVCGGHTIPGCKSIGLFDFSRSNLN